MVASTPPRPPRYFLGVWALYIFLAPFYLFGQGVPQPADYLIVVLGFPFLAIEALRRTQGVSDTLIYGGLFAVLTLAINLAHYAFMTDMRFLYSALYYLFNLGVFAYAVLLFSCDRERAARVTYSAILGSVLLQGILLVTMDDAWRASGTFNNPNQLAYWALLCLACVIVLKQSKPFTFLDYGFIGLCLFIQSMALSKAGLIVSALILAFIFILPNVRTTGRLFLIALILASSVFLAFDPDRLAYLAGGIDELSAIGQRLDTIGLERDDSAAGRGYMRLIEQPAYLLLGAGEGGFNRFGAGAQEIHFGPATIVFSYGITGLFLFVLFLASIFRRLPLR